MSTLSGSAPRLKSHEAVRKMTLTSLLFALALVLSIVEGLLPPIPSPVPMRYGLSNLAVMYALFFLGGKEAYTIAVLKSAFVLITRGLIGGFVSLGGGLVSVTVMLILHRLCSGVSYVFLSMAGAISHNMGQIFVALVIYQIPMAFLYILPWMLLAGAATGILSAILLKLLIPALERLPGGAKRLRVGAKAGQTKVEPETDDGKKSS
jgi:heptaprenyl diphosphate synthase